MLLPFLLDAVTGHAANFNITVIAWEQSPFCRRATDLQYTSSDTLTRLIGIPHALQVVLENEVDDMLVMKSRDTLQRS